MHDHVSLNKSIKMLKILFHIPLIKKNSYRIELLALPVQSLSLEG